MKSIREIVDSVNFHPQNQYHLGIKKYISRTTFAKANEQRDWRIYKDLFFLTNRKTTSLETNANRKFNKNTVFITNTFGFNKLPLGRNDTKNRGYKATLKVVGCGFYPDEN